METHGSKDANVVLDLSGLVKFNGVIRATMYQRGNTPGHQMLRQWGVRYLGFVKRRYVRLSRSGGGGEWPPLKLATIRRRRKGRKGAKGQAAILRDTGTLLAALDIGNPGNLFKERPGYVEVGFAKTGHGEKRRVTIAKLATWHNLGKGRNPQRPILVEPDEKTLAGMFKDGERAVDKILRNAEIKGKG